jgi:hypothetical protein
VKRQKKKEERKPSSRLQQRYLKWQEKGAVCYMHGKLTERAVGAEETRIALAELDGVTVPV